MLKRFSTKLISTFSPRLASFTGLRFAPFQHSTFRILGLVFDIKKYAIHDGPGIRTTVFLKGCPLRCLWCHNPESQKNETEIIQREIDLDGCKYAEDIVFGREMSVDEVMAEVLKDKIYYEESGGGITFSGGEPLYQPDFLFSLLERSKEEGFHTCIDTSGYTEPVNIRRVLPHTDLFLYDLKLADDARHVEFTGVSNELPMKNLEIITSAKAEVIVRFPLIPGITDNEENIRGISQVMKRLELKRIELLPFHKISKHKYEMLGVEYRMGDYHEPSKSELDKAILLFKEHDLDVSFNGN